MNVPWTRPQIALGALCLLLALSCGYELVAPPPEVAIPVLRWRTVNASQPLAMAQPFPAVEAFAALDARPMFNPARKPIELPEDKPSALTALPPPTDLALMGVIIGGDKRIALVRAGTSPVAESVIVGGQLSGWQVSAIEPDHITLHAGSNDYTINLHANRPAGPASPPPVQAMSLPPVPSGMGSPRP